MASTPEKKAKKRVDDLLKQYPIIYFFPPMTGGYGSSGIPDRVGCINGLFFAVEVKADTAVTALQQKNLNDIHNAGGKSFVVRISKNITEGYDELKLWLDMVAGRVHA